MAYVEHTYGHTGDMYSFCPLRSIGKEIPVSCNSKCAWFVTVGVTQKCALTLLAKAAHETASK